MFRYLPDGTWVSFGNFPLEATDEDFQDWLAFHGFELPLENISVKRNGFRALAVVSFQRTEGQNSRHVWAEVQNRIGRDLEFAGRELRMACPSLEHKKK
jgi:hypothetical protein